jgi:hypothetical protein
MRTKAWLGAILFSLLPIIVYAENPKDTLVQELYAKSGMEKQFEQVPLVIQAGFDQAVRKDERLQKLPQNLTAVIRALAPEAFTPESLKAAMVAELRNKLTVQDIKKVLAWLDSPLGKNCTRLEEEASTPETLTELEKFAAQIKNSPPTAKRLDLLRKLDTAIKGAETNIEIAINNQVAIALAANATLPAEQQIPPAQIIREMAKIRPQVEAAVKAQTLISDMYTYRSLTEAQIKQYLDFLRSPAGSKYMSVSMAAFKKALFDGSIKWGKAIGEAMAHMQSQSNV